MSSVATNPSAVTFAGNPFKPATRHALRLRMLFEGPSKSGKTYSMLRLASALCKRIAVLNSEGDTIRKYLGEAPDGIPFQFDIDEPTEFSPTTYTRLILAAGKAGYDGLIIDGLSPAWDGVGGALDQVDHSTDKNSYFAWKNVTPQHRKMLDAIVHSPCHLFASVRSKVEYVIEKDAAGKSVPRKIGMKAIQREGLDYEFDICATMNLDHVMSCVARCPAVDGAVIVKPGATFMPPVKEWLDSGGDIPADYYAITDDDLKAQAAVEASLLTPEQRRAKAEEDRRKRLAGVSGNGASNGNGQASNGATTAPTTATAGTAAPTSPASPTAGTATKEIKADATTTAKPAPITAERKAQILAFCKEHNVGKEANALRAKFVSPFTGKPAEAMGDLSQIQADQLWSALLPLAKNAGTESARSQAAAKEVTPTTATPSASQAEALAEATPAVAGELPADPFAACDRTPGKATAMEQRDLKGLAAETNWAIDGENSQAAFIAAQGGGKTYHGLSQYGIELGKAFRRLVKATSEQRVKDTALKAFGKLPVALNGAELKAVADALACPF